ncbi:MAG: hypothetical protein AB9907_03380 [Flexilinea sp.]
MNSMDLKTDIIAQTDNFIAWKADEPDGETTYHLEVNNITVHFFMEEWEEFLEFTKIFVNIPQGTTGVLAESDTYLANCEKLDSGDIIYSLEITGATLFLFEDDWLELCDLIRGL